MRRHAEATLRNREAIAAVLARHVQPGARVLELASGTGEHAVFLAPRLAVSRWQPSDPDAGARASIDAWREDVPERVAPALALDVEVGEWPPLEVDLVVCINMIHISPWSATEALFRRVRDVLVPGGHLYLYGPYRQADVPTAPSNEAFDASLRARNPAWGLRALEDVLALARAAALMRLEVVPMPANNLSVVLERAHLAERRVPPV